MEVLYQKGAFADVVRECQEIVELALKGLLRHCQIETPHIHDVSDILLEQKERLPPAIHGQVAKMADISRTLRRDRELAFYGTEDLTPTQFYKKADAEKAKQAAEWVVSLVAGVMKV